MSFSSRSFDPASECSIFWGTGRARFEDRERFQRRWRSWSFLGDWKGILDIALSREPRLSSWF